MVNTYNDNYETLACNPRIETDEKTPQGKIAKIKVKDGTIIEGEIID